MEKTFPRCPGARRGGSGRRPHPAPVTHPASHTHSPPRPPQHVCVCLLPQARRASLLCSPAVRAPQRASFLPWARASQCLVRPRTPPEGAGDGGGEAGSAPTQPPPNSAALWTPVLPVGWRLPPPSPSPPAFDSGQGEWCEFMCRPNKRPQSCSCYLWKRRGQELSLAPGRAGQGREARGRAQG